jgi:hypothetical protein
MSVAAGATSSVSEGLKDTSKAFNTETAALGTSHVTRKVLQFGEVPHWFKRRSTRRDPCDDDDDDISQ